MSVLIIIPMLIPKGKLKARASDGDSIGKCWNDDTKCDIGPFYSFPFFLICASHSMQTLAFLAI